MPQQQPQYPYRVTGPDRNWSVTDDGRIARTDLIHEAPAYAVPSGQWRILGAVVYHGRGIAMSYNWPALKQAIQDGGVQWRYKNGKQRLFIRDEDHGTVREWRSPTPYALEVTAEGRRAC